MKVTNEDFRKSKENVLYHRKKEGTPDQRVSIFKINYYNNYHHLISGVGITNTLKLLSIKLTSHRHRYTY